MFLYKITNKINGKIYIGQTINSIGKRWHNHCRKNHGCSAISNAIRKYSKENFTIEEIGGANSQSELNYRGWLLIHNLNSKAPNGYNLKEGGGSKGKFHQSVVEKMKKQRNTEIYKNKQSKKAICRWNNLTSEEKCTKIKKLKEMRNDPKAIDALKEHNNKQWSDTVYRKKMSKLSKDRWAEKEYRIKFTGHNNPNSKKIICDELGICFVSIIDAGKYIDEKDYLNKSKGINACCVGKQKTAHGYFWRYINA